MGKLVNKFKEWKNLIEYKNLADQNKDVVAGGKLHKKATQYELKAQKQMMKNIKVDKKIKINSKKIDKLNNK